MRDLKPDEEVALELVAMQHEHTVLDASTLRGLRRKGLVEMSDDGWSVTVLGRIVVEILEEDDGD